MSLPSNQIYEAAFIATQPSRSRNILACVTKLFEEGGELAEAALFAAGHNQHKTFEEPPKMKWRM